MHGVHRPSWYSLRFLIFFTYFFNINRPSWYSLLCWKIFQVSQYTQTLLVISPFSKIFQLEYEIDPRVNQPGRFQERVEEWRMRSMQRKVQSKWSLPRCLQSIFCNSCLLLNEPAVVVDELEFQKCRSTFCKKNLTENFKVVPVTDGSIFEAGASD